MAAGRLLIPSWMPALDSDGDPISGVKAYFYVNLTTTLASVYGDEALTIPITNPVKANSSGRFPAIWADGDVLYSVAIEAPYGPAGVPFSYDNLSASLGADIAAAEAAEAAADDANAALAGVLAAIEAATEAGGGSAAVAGALAGQAAGTAAANALYANLRQPSGGVTYYVRPDGNDANTGLSNTAGGAFQTPQRAVNAAYSVDLKRSVGQIFIADGTYNSSLNIYGTIVGGFDDGEQPLRIIGNEASPQNVVINPAGQDAIRIGDHASVLLAGLSIGTTVGGNGLVVSNHAHVYHRNLRFLACAGETIAAFGHSSVIALGPTTVVGASGGFVHVTNKAIVSFGNRTLTFVGSLTFTTYLWGINDASIYLDSATIVGAASGGITVHIGGILNVSSCVGIWTGGQPFFVDTGGVIIAEDKIQARILYVRTDGTSQNNSGFANTPAEAFPSVQSAVNRLAQMPYDLVSKFSGADEWTIMVASGDYTFDPVVLPDTKFSRVNIIGASTTNTFMRNYTNKSRRTIWSLRSQRIGSAGNVAIETGDGAQTEINDITFAASAFFGLVSDGGRLYATGNFSIAGASTQSFLVRSNGVFNMNNRTVTITGTPALGTFMAVQSGGFVTAIGATFTGSATGKRYDARANGVIDVNGAAATFLPGDVAGTTATGGQYV